MELMELSRGRFLTSKLIQNFDQSSFKEYFVLVKEGVVRVLKFPFTVGRDNKANLCISNPHISRRQIEIFVSGLIIKDYFVKDLGSTNGTLIIREGKMIELTPNVPVKLKNKDVLSFGFGVEFEVLI